jgi:predicted metal-binding protein
MKIGIIRCDTHSADCAGWHCFPAMREKTGSFADYDTIELVGFDTCGGCGRGTPKNILAKARQLTKQGAEVVHLGCCIVGDCPFYKKYYKALAAEGITIAENTHELPPPEMRKQIHARVEAREKEKERILREHGF